MFAEMLSKWYPILYLFCSVNKLLVICINKQLAYICILMKMRKYAMHAHFLPSKIGIIILLRILL